MSDWTFTHKLTGETIENGHYTTILKSAKDSKPTAYQSGYPLKAAAITEGGVLILGSNHEYGITQGIHYEESLITQALAQAGEHDKIIAYGVLTPHEGATACPCGNCRDLLQKYLHPDAVFMYGPSQGGEATIIPFSAFVKEEFRSVKVGKNMEGLLEAREAELIANDTYINKKITPHASYGAAITTSAGTFKGSFWGAVPFHNSHPILSAITTLRNGSKDPARFEVGSLVVAATNHKPEVQYLDRQHFLEFSDQVAAYKEHTTPIPVTLVELGPRGGIKKAWKTDAREWLPYPFSPAELGMENELRHSITKLVGD